MKVTLAADYGKHKADETVELPDDEARLLLFEGGARLPDSSTVPADHAASTPARAPKEKS